MHMEREEMLSKIEIDRILKNKKREIMVDEGIATQAETWNLKVSGRMVGLVYHYMKYDYKEKESLEVLERNMGVSRESIVPALRALEYHGYLSSTKLTKPYLYRVVK